MFRKARTRLAVVVCAALVLALAVAAALNPTRPVEAVLDMLWAILCGIAITAAVLSLIVLLFVVSEWIEKGE